MITINQSKLEQIRQELQNIEHWKKGLEKLALKEFPYKEEVMQDLTNIVYGDSQFEINDEEEQDDFFHNLQHTPIFQINRRQYYIDAIVDGSFKWSIPEKVAIAKADTTKKRIVYVYPPKERLLQGVLYRALSKVFEQDVPDNCFSYKKGVSTNDAILYIRQYKKESKLYGLKMDISSYFNSVSKEHVEKTLDDLFADVPSLHKTMSNLMLTDIVLEHGQLKSEYKSLIAGSPLGSFFANYCLREVDIYFKEQGVIYARYSDDIIVLDETEEKVQQHTDKVKSMIASYGLTINPKKYVHFLPHEAVEYLGLSLDGYTIDVSQHAVNKMKKTIKRWVKKSRYDISTGNSYFEKEASKLVKRLNYKLYKCYILDKSKFGWGIYAFRYINTTESLRVLDYYLRDQLRYLKTGKHNKHNWVAISEEQFQQLGVVSLEDMYHLFKTDFDYYVERVYNL